MRVQSFNTDVRQME